MLCIALDRPTSENFFDGDLSVTVTFLSYVVQQCFVVDDVRRHSSRLRIENAMLNDTGTYRCFAVNSVGRSRPKRTRVVVSAIPSRCPSNSRPCVNQTFCLNGGLCCDIDMLAVKLCQ